MQIYADMKDSGFAWLGLIPADWSRIKLCHIATKFSNGTTATQLDSQTDYPVTRIQTISTGEINLDKVGYISKDNAIEKYLLQPNDILFSNINSLSMVGNVALVDTGGLYHGMNLLRISPSKVNPSFLLYLLRSSSYQQYFSSTAKPAINQASIPASTIKATPVAVPDMDTQQKIADFLDTETAQIDNLIAKQERLLELLEEKRRATITHAVTRGLNPGVELKETNIPWPAQIPAHWNVKRIKDLFSANDEALGQKTDPNYGFDYVDISSVDKYRGIIKKEKMTFEKSPSRARRIVREGDIIIGAVRTYLEAIAQISEDATSLIVSTGFVVLRPKDVGDSDFYFYALRSGSFMANVVANSDGVSYPAINADKLMSLQIAVPPKEEMRTIIEHCKLEMSRMDELKQKIQTQITLLRERRTSLISHVVTGKVMI